jgi:hypothetical protein
MPVNPMDPSNHDKILWCVHGVESFPEIFCCKIRAHAEFGPIIWGYSVYRRKPGFRTLGQNVNTWMQDLRTKFGCDLFEFYDDHGEAIARITQLTTPKGSL